jgi:hypothetical protein
MTMQPMIQHLCKSQNRNSRMDAESMLSAWCLPLTRGEDLPALVIALAPLPEHNLCAVVEVGVELVAVLDIEVEVDIVHHAHIAESLAHVQASPSTAPTRPGTPGCTTKASLGGLGQWSA